MFDSRGAPPSGGVNRADDFRRSAGRVDGESFWSENLGEPWRDRTSDPLIKSQLLYQLS